MVKCKKKIGFQPLCYSSWWREFPRDVAAPAACPLPRPLAAAARGNCTLTYNKFNNLYVVEEIALIAKFNNSNSRESTRNLPICPIF